MDGVKHTLLKEGFFVKKFKKVMALSLALAMGLSLCACGGSDDTTEAPVADTEAATEGVAGTEEVAEVEMPAEEGETIYVYSWNTELGLSLIHI